MIELQHISKTFVTSARTVEALKDVSLSVEDGDIFGIIGMSGAGKSTLVRCINLLERPTEGRILIDGTDMVALSQKELRAARRNITMIFQGFNLLMQRTCLKNVCFPMELAGVRKKDAVARARELLEIVGLPDKADAYPAQLSGGQQQRVAIARALATNPRLLLCDEATSALDPSTTTQILSLIKDINQKMGITVIVITHQMSVIQDICNNVAILNKGVVAEVGPVSRVFSRPQSEAAQRLVFPEKHNEVLPTKEGETVVRASFNGSASAEKPLIASLAIDTGIRANILASTTRTMNGLMYGTIMLGIPTDKVEEALNYMNGEGVVAEEVNLHE